MIQEYSDYLQSAASLSLQTADTFKGIQFDEKSQAVELFALQSLAMCDSHCRASALLMRNNFPAETVMVLRPIQELLFDIHWILQPETKEERLERVYKLEADPYARWDRETKLIAKGYSAEKARQFRVPLDKFLTTKVHLVDLDQDGTKSFKAMNTSLADRMGDKLRPLYYHIFMFGSLFSHPTPANKNLYLERRGVEKNVEALEESLRQFVAYSILSVLFIAGYSEKILGAFSASAKTQRDDLFQQMIELVEKANKEYFSNPFQAGRNE